MLLQLHSHIEPRDSAAWKGKNSRGAPQQFIGNDPDIRALLEKVRRVARGSVPILVMGETGTGKELIAQAIHDFGRNAGPFVVINGGALPRDLCEAELFGHERGAFTGAVATRAGVFEEADGGTLLLDEIGELPLELQPKLLRVLDTGMVRRLGGTQTRRVDVRVVAATNRDLCFEVRARRFRADLYHRLAAVTLRIPALRERRADIPELVEHFVSEEQREGRNVEVSEAAMNWLSRQPWLGNVRELRNAVRRAALLGDGLLAPRDFEGEPLVSEEGEHPTYVCIAGRSEDEILRDVYRKSVALHRGSARRAAKALDVPRSTFSDRLRRLGITSSSEPEVGPDSDGGSESDVGSELDATPSPETVPPKS